MPISDVFSIELTASDEDIDFLGHVSNVRYVAWLQDVATAHSASLGLTWAEYREIGGVFVVRRHEIDYLRPAYAGDRLALRTWVESWKQASSTRMYSIERLADARGQVHEPPVQLTRATTIWAYVSVNDGRPIRIPPLLKERFRSRAEPAG